MLKAFFHNNKRAIVFGSLGTVIGAFGGFLYWKFVGCIDGTCAIWSNPFKATLYGALMGGLLLLAFVPDKSKSKKPTE